MMLAIKIQFQRHDSKGPSADFTDNCLLQNIVTDVINRSWQSRCLEEFDGIRNIYLFDASPSFDFKGGSSEMK